MFTQEVSDESKVQLEDNPGNFATPFQLGGDQPAGAFMEHRVKKARNNMLNGYTR